MKKYIYVSTILLSLILNYACDSSMPEEQFEKNVSLIKNGWIEQTIEFGNSGVISIPLNVSVSGTSINMENVNVAVDFAPNILAVYNFEKYREQPALYYKQLPTEAVTFEKSVINIAKGEDTGKSKLFIDLNKITNKYADYVIPIQIVSASKYILGDSIYTNVLYHLQFRNSFSGTYSAGTTVYKTKGSAGTNDEDNKITVANKVLYAVSDNECYFYAGQMDRSKVDKENFIVNIIRNNDGTVTMSSLNPNLNFVLESVTIKEVRETDHNDLRIEKVTTTIYMQYTFSDLTLLTPIKLRAQGTISMAQYILK